MSGVRLPQVTVMREAGMPNERALESRASAEECLRLAANATDAGSRASLLLLAQKLLETADRRASRNLAPPDVLLPDK